MPWKEDGSRKKSNLYKKSSGFKMKNPIKFMGAIMGAVTNSTNMMGSNPRRNRRVR